MSITQSLYDYLVDPTELTGHPARKFRVPQSLNGWTIETRNDARRYFRDQVGRSIYADRRPTDSNAHTAVVLKTLASDPNFDLAGADAENTHFIEVNVLTRAVDSARRCMLIGKLIELACSGFHHDYWGETYIGECTVDRDGSNVFEPIDASDNWTHRYTVDMKVIHDDVMPVFSMIPLQAVITYPNGFGEGASFIFDAAASIVPEGREIVNVAWTVSRQGFFSVAFNGAPQAAVATSGITGTYLNPALTRASFTGANAGFIQTVCIITDDDGQTSTALGSWR